MSAGQRAPRRRLRSSHCACCISYLTSTFHELGGDLRRAAAPPPCGNEQQRQRAQEPGERGRSISEQRITRIVLTRDRLRNGPSGERVNERQDFAVTGRAALVHTAAVDVLDLAVSFLARAADHALAG